jgi:hypothetical protein
MSFICLLVAISKLRARGVPAGGKGGRDANNKTTAELGLNDCPARPSTFFRMSYQKNAILNYLGIGPFWSEIGLLISGVN